ncbi:MAG: hypothetical protein V1927_01440, partial [Candidatus Omnitrophota bacterium]
MLQILGNRVRGSSFKLRPYKFSRIKLGRIAGKEMCVDSLMPFKAFLNEGSSMNLTLIPQKNNRTLEMTQNMVQKPFDLRRLDVFTRMESDIQG